jgi:hypothetical protein
MVELTGQKLQLAEITRQEVQRYVGHTENAIMYALLDDKNQRYGAVLVPEEDAERPSYLVALARVEGDYVVIDEDGALDKPLHQALMVNGGVPREQIILAYRGETIPEADP